MSEPNTTELPKSDSETSRSMSDASDEALETAKEMPESEQDQNADTTDGEDTPKYALEINAYGDVVQAKTIRDLDISDEDVLKAIAEYVKELKKEIN
jgi:hypothetical protein